MRNWRWKLEVGRMVSYVSFPVVMFYLFNQPWFHATFFKSSQKGVFLPDHPDAKYITERLKQIEAEKEKQWEEEMQKHIDAFSKQQERS